jgi:predicted Zn-dependent peptidase
VSEAEVEQAQRTLEVDLISGMGTSHALASRIGQDVTTFGRIRPLEELLGGIRKVTPADVQRVAETWLRADGRNVIHVIAPPANEAGAEPAPDVASSAPEGSG